MPSGAIDALRQRTHWFSLNEKLLKGVLCFMLFRGSVNVRWGSLHEQQWLVLSLVFADTAMTCPLTGALAYAGLSGFGIAVTTGAVVRRADRRYRSDAILSKIGLILMILQAMDAAGKDGAIKHVMSGMNPQDCEIFSFKSPSADPSSPRPRRNSTTTISGDA